MTVNANNQVHTKHGDCLIESVTSSEYNHMGRFKLTPKDISLLSQELKNALIPFQQVKITGDLGEGTEYCNFVI